MNIKDAKSPWTEEDKKNWYKEQTIKRSYKRDVLDQLELLKTHFEVFQYGALSLAADKYPLFLIKSLKFCSNKMTVLITGGVHGYETSGVQGAIEFMRTLAPDYESRFNFLCAPCISPWSYETVNRWNAAAIDPNRSFFQNSPSEECRLFLNAIAPHLKDVFVHIDLHETTDTDNTIFRPALEARDGKEYPFSPIPDGFYTVADAKNPCPEFQKSIVDAVKSVTHIAPPDSEGKIIGEPLLQEGVILYDFKKLFLCAGVSEAKFTTTTEVYPDSPKANDAICKAAQVAAIRGGLDFVLRMH